MNDNQFSTVWSAALAAPDRDAFVSDWALSSLFVPPDDSFEVDPLLIDQLGRIWDVAHMRVKDMRMMTGLTQAAFSAHFCIPKRTLEDWERALRNPPDYVRLMLAQLLGLITR